MTDVKPLGRTTLRAERAAVTRARILGAARTSFAAQGYGATTLTAIAAEAGVAVQTIYAVFGSKPGVLQALLEEAINQPEADALAGRAMAEPDPGRTLDLFAASIRQRWERVGDIVEIHAQAAATDPSARAGVEGALQRRRAGIGRIAASLGPTVDVRRATALIDALTLPAVYSELVDVQGWTPDAYETWLATTLREQLLRG